MTEVWYGAETLRASTIGSAWWRLGLTQERVRGIGVDVAGGTGGAVHQRASCQPMSVLIIDIVAV